VTVRWIKWSRLGPGFYESNYGYEAQRGEDGTWFLTYPGRYSADDFFLTLRDLKDAAELDLAEREGRSDPWTHER